MRKSFINPIKTSKIHNVDNQQTKQSDSSFEICHKSKFGQRLSEINRVPSMQLLNELETINVISYNRSLQKSKDKLSKAKNNQYDFLKQQKTLQHDPFLKAKMKYLLNKELQKQDKKVPHVQFSQRYQRNNPALQKKQTKYTTLKRQSQKVKSQKMLILHFAQVKNKNETKKHIQNSNLVKI